MTADIDPLGKRATAKGPESDGIALVLIWLAILTLLVLLVA